MLDTVGGMLMTIPKNVVVEMSTANLVLFNDNRLDRSLTAVKVVFAFAKSVGFLDTVANLKSLTNSVCCLCHLHLILALSVVPFLLRETSKGGLL